MNIMLGNLTVTQIESRLGIQFPDEIRDYMKNNHQPSANNIKKGEWHCFDIPFNLVCGDIETATRIYDSIKERISEIKGEFQISIKDR